MSQQPPAPTPVSIPPIPDQSPQPPPERPGWTASIDPGKLWVGAASAAASYLTVFAVGLSLFLLALAGMATSNNGVVVPQSSPALPGQDQLNAWSQVGQLAAQLIAMAHLGGLGAGIDGAIPFLGTIRGEASAYAVPLTILIVSVLSLYLSSRIAEHKLPSASRSQLLSQSLVTGAVYSVLINVVAVAAAVRYPSSNGISVAPVTAAGFWSIAISLCLGTGVSALARNRAATGRASSLHLPRWMARLNLPVAALASHTLLFAAVAIPVGWIIAVASYGWSGLLTAPLWIFNAVGYALVAGHLGGFRLFTEVTQIMGGSSNRSEDQVIFGLGADVAGGSAAGAVWGALALALICTMAAGTVVLLRRGQADTWKVTSWFGVPAAFLILGLLLLPLLTASVRYKIPGLASGEFSAAPAWWSPVVFLAWGLLVELSSRFVSPYLLPFLPARLQNAARLGVSPAEAAPAPPQISPFSSTDPGQERMPGAANQVGGTDAAPKDLPEFVDPVSKRLSPAGKKRAMVALIALGTATVVTVAGLVTVNLAKAATGPDKLVAQYVQALVDGDAERALTISDPNVPNEDRALLTNAVYGSAAKRVDGFSVLSTEVSGDSASVRLELQQDGRKSEVTYALVKDHPGLLDDNWKLQTTGLQTITLSADAPVGGFSVNGVAVKSSSENSGALGTVLTLSAFPGEYTVTLPKDEKFMEADEQRALVTIGTGKQAPEGAGLEVRGTAALQAEVARQLEASWAACAKSADLKPKGCPFSSYSFGGARNVKWSVVSKPEFSMERSYDGTWRLNSEADGTADVSYEQNSSFNKDKPDWTPTTDSVQFGAHGNVKVEAGKVLFEPSWF